MASESGPAEISSLEPASHTLQEPRAETSPSAPPAYTLMADDHSASGHAQQRRSGPASTSERSPLLTSATARRGGRGPSKTTAKPQKALINVLYFAVTVLLFLSISALLFVGISTLHPWAGRILPPHHGSTFVPFWYCLLSALVLLLAVSYFSFPHSTPHFFTYLSLATSFLAVVDIIIIGANPDLRAKESWLAVTAAILLLVAGLVAAACLPAVERFLPAVEAAAEARRAEQEAERQRAEEEERRRQSADAQHAALPIPIEQPECPPSAVHAQDPEVASSASGPTTRNKMRRCCMACLEFTGVTLPLLVLHIAILVALVLMTADLILRAYDFSAPIPDPGRLWDVSPGDGSGTYRVLLACQPFGGEHRRRDPKLIESLAEDNATLPRRTLLVFSPAGVAGLPSAAWALNLSSYSSTGDRGPASDLRTHAHQRICYFDRPGYGFSDNAPTARLRHTVVALEQALEQSGEDDRLTGRGGGRDRGGYVLVAQGFGGMVARVFASRNPETVTGIVFIDSQTELTYFNPAEGSWKKTLRHLFADYGSAVLSPLGVRRFVALIVGTTPSLSRRHPRSGSWRPPNRRGRLARMLSPARDGLSPSIVRATLQEAHLAHSRLSSSYQDLDRSRSNWPSGIKTIVISSKGPLKEGTRWSKGQEWLASALTKEKDLLRWDWVEGDGDPCYDQGPGLAACSAAVHDLLVR